MTTIIYFVHKTSWGSEEGSLLLHMVSARAGPWGAGGPTFKVHYSHDL